MIKNYKQHVKESLLNKLEGPSHIEIINNFKNNYNELLKKGIANKDEYLIKFALDNGAYSTYISEINYLLENDYISSYNLINKHPHVAFKYYTNFYNKENLLSCLELGIIPDSNFIKDNFNRYDDDVLIQIFKNGIKDLDKFKEYIIYYRKNDTLKYILEKLKDVNDSLMFLLYSIKYENYNGFNTVLKYMIKNNFDLNYSNGYLFYYTVKKGQLNMLENLVSSGLRFGEYYNKSLEVAKSSGYDDIYKYIIKIK